MVLPVEEDTPWKGWDGRADIEGHPQEPEVRGRDPDDGGLEARVKGPSQGLAREQLSNKRKTNKVAGWQRTTAVASD